MKQVGGKRDRSMRWFRYSNDYFTCWCGFGSADDEILCANLYAKTKTFEIKKKIAAGDLPPIHGRGRIRRRTNKIYRIRGLD